MDEKTYLLAKAVTSTVFTCLCNAYSNRHDEQAVERNFRRADFFEMKFKNEYKLHPQAYIEIYENHER